MYKNTSKPRIPPGFPIAIVASALILTSCASSRPEGLSCNLEKYLDDPDRLMPFAPGRAELNVLSLSAGGEYGAYGAGFLVGWAASQNPWPIKPADMTVVTGVSTGALVASHAFLGRFAEVEALYNSISGPEIYKERGLLSLLFANSLTDAAGKDGIIEKALDSKLIDEVAEEAERRPYRKLMVGAVDLDSGEFLKINLSKLASDKANGNRVACYRAAIGAASAIPVVFPPVFVDGRMLVDGGARHHAFIQKLEANYLDPDVTKRLFAIYHGDFKAGTAKVKNGIPGIAKQTSAVITDQLIKDTAYRLDYVARFGPANRRFETYYADARQAAEVCRAKKSDPSCLTGGSAGSSDMFCKPFMQCLSSEGRRQGAAVSSTAGWTRELMTANLGSQP